MSSPILMWPNQYRRDPDAKAPAKALQAALGVTADGLYGQGTAAAVAAWQAEHGFDVTGLVTAAMCAALGVECAYVEKRVRVDRYGSLPSDSPLLVPVPSSTGRVMRLHTLAAAGMARMGVALEADLGIELAICSGWRPHRWRSKRHYAQEMVRRYGSVGQGRRFMAYASPHETGLAMDIGVGGLEARSATIARQKRTDIYAWLVANAGAFGWHPYKREPWHWEFAIGQRSWETGVADCDQWVPRTGAPILTRNGDDEDLYVEAPLDDTWDAPEG